MKGEADGGSRRDASPEPEPDRDATPAPTEASRCVVPEGGDCNPVRQCNCPDDQVCRALGDQERAECDVAGDAEPWGACQVAAQCPAGQTCDRGSCRPYCAKDEDCAAGSCLPARTPSNEPSEKYKVCWQHCEPSAPNTCAEGTACHTLKTPYGDTGTFCVAPLDPCPKVEDGQCDDPTGSGLCAAGSDNLDCLCTSRLPDSQCDPVTQCGCERGAKCVARQVPAGSTTWRAECEPAGTVRQGESCESSEQCIRGMFCFGPTNTCEKYCASDAECGDGACSFFTTDLGPVIGRCRPACKAGDDAACPKGSVCAEVDVSRYFFNRGDLFKKSGHFCFEPLGPEGCPDDDVCDDPTGTKVCAAGADDKDCCDPPGDAGECNPYRQCGCGEKPGTACVLTDLWDKTACLPTGKLAEGSVCTGTVEQCPEGYGCVYNVCRKYCAGDADCGDLNLCLKQGIMTDRVARYGACTVRCDPTDADSCPAGSVCMVIGVADRTACVVPELCNDAPDGRCEDTRPGGSHRCEIGTDNSDCCPNIAEGAECDPDANCGCERKPGTHCVRDDGDSPALCQPIHAEPLADACENVSDPSCCNPPVVGSECDPVHQCGCEEKPNTHCQVINSAGIGGCVPFGALPRGSICSSVFEQCSAGNDCHMLDGLCRKPCVVDADCDLDSDQATKDASCMKPATDGVGHCMELCNFETEQPCQGSTRCAPLDGDQSYTCMQPLRGCPFTSNQQCDDTRPGGTRLCAYGSDPECQ